MPSRQPDAGLLRLLGDPGALLEDRVGEPHDPLDPGAGGGGDLLRGLAGADAGLDDPRRQFGAEVDVDLGEPAGVAAGGRAQAVVDRQLEAARSPSAPSAARIRLFPSSESATRRRCAWTTS